MPKPTGVAAVAPGGGGVRDFREECGGEGERRMGVWTFDTIGTGLGWGRCGTAGDRRDGGERDGELLDTGGGEALAA